MREFDLIRRIMAGNADLPEYVTIPPGDDMAGLMLGDRELLVAVDQIIHGVHFDLVTTSIELIARKAITRNLSDVAAMAARPLATLCSAILPRKMPQDKAQALFDALQSTTLQFGCPLIGGDTAIHDGPLTLSISILAEPDGIAPVRRDTARVGDAIYVTGQLGGSMYISNHPPHHLTFEPRLQLARALAGDPATRPTAMIDLSDGLARDLPHLIDPINDNGAGAEIYARDLPVSVAARQIASRDGRPGWLHAVNDGEDYELLFTAPPDAHYPDQIDGVRISRVGNIVESPGNYVIDNQERIAIDGLGWEHNG